jgi:hypothetical protein
MKRRGLELPERFKLDLSAVSSYYFKDDRGGQPMKDDFIAASEIAEYLYCQRAWWYRLRGAVSANRAVMVQGTEQHEGFAKAVTQVEQGRQLGGQFSDTVKNWQYPLAK